MSLYQLSPHASGDLFGILDYLEEYHPRELLTDTAVSLVAAFKLLAANPGIGHRRRDLTSRPFYFHTVEPYLIIYARGEDPLPVLGILHASREVRKVLRKRFA